MRIEEVLGWTHEQCKDFKDEAFLEAFKEALTVTRPEFAPRPKAASERPLAIAQTPQFQDKLKKLQALGIDISVNDFKSRKKR